MSVIDIGSVLKRFDLTYDDRDLVVRDYSIRFITADGRLRTMRARKNVKSPKQQLQKPLQKRAKGLFNLQRNGTMLVQDLALDSPRTVKVAVICFFKDFQQTIWNIVRH